MELADLTERLTEFLSEFYKNELITASAEGRRFIIIDFSLIDKFDIELADYLLENPEETFATAEEAARQIETGLAESKAKLRFTNIPESRDIRIRNIRAEHIGKLIVVDGFVRRASEIRPEVSESIFQCSNCGMKIAIMQTERMIRTPMECESCDNKRSFKLLQQKLFDARWLVIEEPSEITSGERPSNIKIYLKDDLTSTKIQNKTEPGNRIKIVGVLKELPKRFKGLSSRQMDIYIEANYIEAIETEWEELEISLEEEQKIIELAKDPLIYEKLVQSMAPALYGLNEVKEGISLQLFGGVPKILRDRTRVRGDIHLLLIGDPSTAKSAMIKVISSLIPRGKYVSGKGVSSAGLTATVMKDEEFMGGWVLEAGAMVMCNRSLLGIDEFEKIDKEDQVALHEALEQQSYHPDTEITLSDGRKYKIGELVDGMFERNKEKIIQGVNCEILPAENLSILTTDFRKIYPTDINRVSRHLAPREFVKITYSNGRTTVVTPEHPIWKLSGSKIETVPAESVEPGIFVPIPKKLPLLNPKGEMTSVSRGHPREKVILNPKKIDTGIARILGYYASEGHNFVGQRSSEIGFTNTNPLILNEIKSRMLEGFGLKPYTQPHLSTVFIHRYTSTQLHKFFRFNFSSLLQKARMKKVPDIVLGSNNEVASAFLSTAYLGDGFVDSERFGFCTTSLELAKGYQELLLKLGIYSYITRDAKQDSYKIVVSGTDSMRSFLEEVLDKQDRRRKRIEVFLKRSEKNNRQRGDFPYTVGKEIKEMLSLLKMDDGYFCQTIEEECGVTEKTLRKYVKKIRCRTDEMNLILSSESDIASLRKSSKISQQEIENRFGIKHQTLSYIERNRNHKRRPEIESYVKSMIKEKINKADSFSQNLENLMESEVGWIEVKKVERIKNEDCKWVYDVTVEPTRSFISECLVLHNTISIAKANIVATLPAQTSILAGANPKLGRFDPYLPIKEQIDIPETLLSRFDLKFALRDVPNAELDAKIAEHMMRSRFFAENEAEPIIRSDLMRKYIAYARKNCKPRMSQEAAEELKNFYLSLRSRSGEESPIAITPRQYEGLIRLSEASAKVQLREFVVKEDAIRAINLMKASLRMFGFEPETGKIDIDRAEGQKSTAAQRSRIRVMVDVIDDLTKKYGRDIPVEDILKQARTEGLDMPEDILRKMLNEGMLFSPRQGFINKL